MTLAQKEAEGSERIRNFLEMWNLLKERVEQIGLIYAEAYQWFRPDHWTFTLSLEDSGLLDDGNVRLYVTAELSSRGGIDYNAFSVTSNLLWKEDKELTAIFRESYEAEQVEKTRKLEEDTRIRQQATTAKERLKLAELLVKYPDMASSDPFA